MNVHRILRPRGVGLAVGAAAALAVGLATANPAGATQSPSARVAHDTLMVTGRAGSDRIALRLAPGAPGTLQVDLNDDGAPEQTFDRNTFSRINVFTGSSDDRFRIDQVNGSLADEAVTIDGGSGDDTIDGGDGAELLIGRSGNDAIDGNHGNDTAALGSGSDSFRWDPGDGSDVVEGQSGTDTLDFNGSGQNEQMSLSPNGSRSLFLRDVANIRMDMDHVERLDLAALGGADTFTIEDMSRTDMSDADVDLSAPEGGGDDQMDTVTVKGTARADQIDVEAEGGRVDVEGLQTEARIAGSEVTDQLQVDTVGGDDDVDVDQDALALIDVLVDLGTGEL
jgi:Ca2+-binding RTX toxin-like protein